MGIDGHFNWVRGRTSDVFFLCCAVPLDFVLMGLGDFLELSNRFQVNQLKYHQDQESQRDTKGWCLVPK